VDNHGHALRRISQYTVVTQAAESGEYHLWLDAKINTRRSSICKASAPHTVAAYILHRVDVYCLTSSRKDDTPVTDSTARFFRRTLANDTHANMAVGGRSQASVLATRRLDSHATRWAGGHACVVAAWGPKDSRNRQHIITLHTYSGKQVYVTCNCSGAVEGRHRRTVATNGTMWGT